MKDYGRRVSVSHLKKETDKRLSGVPIFSIVTMLKI